MEPKNRQQRRHPELAQQQADGIQPPDRPQSSQHDIVKAARPGRAERAREEHRPRQEDGRQVEPVAAASARAAPGVRVQRIGTKPSHSTRALPR